MSGGTTSAFQSLGSGFVTESAGIRVPLPTFSLRFYGKSLLVVVGRGGIVSDLQLTVRGER